MENSNSFPLFRLPRIVIEEVMRTMTPFEMINFSMTSSRFKFFVKSYLSYKRNSKYTISFATTEEPFVSIKGSEINFEFRITSDEKKNGNKEYLEYMGRDKTERIWVYSEDVVDDWMKLVRTAKEIFTFNYHTFYFKLDKFPESNRSIVDFLKTQTESIDWCEFHGKTGSDTNVEYFFNNITVIDYVAICSELSDYFLFPRVDYAGHLAIVYGNWVTFNQLLQFKSHEITIYNSQITNHELNMLLLHWMANECHQNLMYLTINIKDPQSLETILNLPHEIVNSDVERTGRLSNNKTISLQGGIDIKRNDGMTGTIKFEWRLDELLLKMLITRIQ